jgi:DNA repair protein RecN (Recombination protein N)
MLAIKDILLERDRISSMIFDEIDTGIGGDTANAIAAKIKSIARKHQIICVTHLAQIAAVADHHLQVSKQVRQGTTSVAVSALAPEERETEIARMLSGKITETTKAHAKELLGV